MWDTFHSMVTVMLAVQMGGHIATSFQLRPVRSSLRKTITRRTNRTKKKPEPGGCHFLNANYNSNSIPVHILTEHK